MGPPETEESYLARGKKAQEMFEEASPMYMIIYWMGDMVFPVTNEDASIKLFVTLKEADAYANANPASDEMRVISTEGVKE